MKEFFRKNWRYLLILVVVMVSYGQTLGMYFWQDDSALIFRLQNPIGQMGSFGPSIWADTGPYRYMVIPFVPFFKIFGLEPFGYFLIGLILYAVAAFTFNLLAMEVFSNKKVSLVSSIFFAAGYVGSDTMFRIINSWQSCVGLILSILTLYFYVKFAKKGGWKNYTLALMAYLGSIELVYIRSHSLIASIVAADILLIAIDKFRIEKTKSIFKFLFRIIPFILMFYWWYLTNSSFGAPGLITLANEILSGNISKLMPLFATIGNALVPDILLTRLSVLFRNGSALLIFALTTALFTFLTWKLSRKKLSVASNIIGNCFLFTVSYIFFEQGHFWYKDVIVYISGTLGLLLSFNILQIGVMTWSKNGGLGKILILGYVILASQAFGYYIQYPTSVFSTTHRYLFFAFIGYSILIPAFLLIISQSIFSSLKLFYLTSVVIILVNLLLSVDYQSELVTTRSIPSRIFYKSMLEYVPRIDKGSIFYFDVKEDPMRQRQFSDFFSVGSMPESTALAIYYGLDRDEIKYVTNFDELISVLDQNPENIGKTYFFYYGDKGLQNNTQIVRDYLGGSKDKFLFKIIKKNETETELNPSTTINSSISTLLKLTAVVSVGDLNTATKTKSKALKPEQKKMALSYFAAREQYFKSVRLSGLSEWRYQEVFNAADQNLDTSWRGHRIYWDDNEHDYIQVDLGSTKNINRVVWTNWISTLCPIDYDIQVSLDGKNWQVVKSVRSGSARQSGEVVVEEFRPVFTRYVRMDITKTLTNDSPAISEIEAIESKYESLDLKEANVFLSSPFDFIRDLNEFNQYGFNFARLSKIRVVLRTDKGVVKKTLPVGYFNRQMPYSITLPAGGTKIDSIAIEVDKPLLINVVEAKIENLTLDDMKSEGLVKKFSLN